MKPLLALAFAATVGIACGNRPSGSDPAAPAAPVQSSLVTAGGDEVVPTLPPIDCPLGGCRPITVPPVVMEEPADGIPDGIVGEKGKPQLFKLVNKGDSETQVVKLSIQGDGDFQLDRNECSGKPLAGKTTCEFTVVFTPQAPGTRIAALQVTAGGVILTGTKLIGRATKPVNPPVPSPSALTFDGRPVGDPSPPETMTLHNAGATSTGMLAMSITGPHAADFHLASNSCTAPLAPNATCVLQVVFRPTASGNRTAALVVTAGAGGSATAALIGSTLLDEIPRVQRRRPNTVNGGWALFPSDDEGLLFAAWPDRPVGIIQPTALTVLAANVTPLLLQMEFRLPGTIGVPASAPRRLPGGDYNRLVASTCNGLPGRSPARSICNALAGEPSERQRRIEAALGMSVADLRAEVQRPLEYWFFSQRLRGVPIEHKGLMALRHPGRQVSRVFGSLLNRFVVVNEVALDGTAAVERARPGLVNREKLVNQRPLDERLPAPVLVLLPSGRNAAGVRELRFAYRAAISALKPASGERPGVPVSYTVWVDAQNANVLKFRSDFADATEQTWCRDPSEAEGDAEGSSGVPACLSDVVGEPGNPGFFTLGGGATVFNPFTTEANLYPDQFPNTAPAYSHEPAVCERDPAGTFDPDQPSVDRFRQVNAFAHLSRAYERINAGGVFPPFSDKITVKLDQDTDHNSSNFTELALRFRTGNIPSPDCNSSPQTRNGAVDGTILAHEMAHLATQQLQRSALSLACTFSSCPVRDPLNRGSFHDFADGYAALLAGSPCIGGWAGPTPGLLPVASIIRTPEVVANACVTGGDLGDLPRLLWSDPLFPTNITMQGATATSAGESSNIRQDVFPELRRQSTSEYTDGQLVGSAIWLAQQGMISQADIAGTLPVWGRLNQAVFASGFMPAFCNDLSHHCDRNIYRFAREVMLQMLTAWVTSAGPRSRNKVLSAFARAGFSLVPEECFDGSDTTKDYWFCPPSQGVETSGDAVVDIFDGQVQEGAAQSGVFVHEDDYVNWSQAADTVLMRVWTGVRKKFSTSRDALQMDEFLPADLGCNNQVAVFYRYPSDPLPPDAFNPGGWRYMTTTDTPRPVRTVANCQVDLPIPASVWADITSRAQASTTGLPFEVEYKVVTWNSRNVLATIRDSNLPGGGFWSSTPELAPAVFFVNGTGQPAL